MGMKFWPSIPAGNWRSRMLSTPRSDQKAPMRSPEAGSPNHERCIYSSPEQERKQTGRPPQPERPGQAGRVAHFAVGSKSSSKFWASRPCVSLGGDGHGAGAPGFGTIETMMKKLLPFLLLSGACFAQDITTLGNVINQIFHPPAVVLTVTASQGDGTVCTLAKIGGSVINAYLNCTTATTASLKASTLQASGTVMQSTVWGLGDVLCILAANPSATAIAAQGSLGAIPAVSVGWSCSTNIRTAGAITGQTAIVNGSVSWP
jgi:hypothetical protein